MDVVTDTQELMEVIEKRTSLFVLDNYKEASPKDFHLIRSAILIGVMIGIDWESKTAQKIVESKMK